MNVKDIRKKMESMNIKRMEYSENVKGVSVVIPVYDGIKFMEQCLVSLKSQILKDAVFEVILIFNGKFRDDIEKLYSSDKYFENLDITVLINDNTGASSARNLGINYSKYSHITFVDIDDYVSENYIQSLFENLDDDTITFTQIYNIGGDELDIYNPLNKEILDSHDKNNITYSDLSKILTISACKAIPKRFLLINLFKEYLKSGEDTVLFTELLVNVRPKLDIVPLENNAIYYRLIRNNSVSRRAGTYDFLINQRIDILKILEPMLDYIANPEIKKIVLHKYRAQIAFMNRYLLENPSEHNRVTEAIEAQNFQNFDYRILNRNLSDTLIISYCFAPYSDTSASIVMKRILGNKQIVDVVSNDMKPIRSKDYSIKKVIDSYVGSHLVSRGKPSFSGFNYLKRFIDDAFLFYCKHQERYKTVYSRVMFPVSHIPPLFIKLLNPNIFWKAEFSDPMLYDIDSNTRNSEIDDPQLLAYLKSGILRDFTRYVDENLFNLSEIIPFALADELIFTNKQQMEYMIQRFPVELQKTIKRKSTISSHPTLPREYYNLVESNYKLERFYVNIAYFGNFYSKRDVTELIKIKNKMEDSGIMLYKFHVFTNTSNLSDQQKLLADENEIIINPLVPYFEFLNLTNAFDILLVFDTITKDIKNINPYLPSKYSDYKGSDSIVMAVTENDSVLSKLDDNSLYKVHIDSIENASLGIDKLEKSLMNKKEEYIINDNTCVRIKGEKYTIELDDSLELNIVNGKWQVKPKISPLSFDNNYEVSMKNEYKEPIILNINSHYSKKGIIKVIVRNSDKINKTNISNFKSERSFTINPNDEISFTLDYTKEYKSPSFALAGRLSFEIIS